MAQKAPSAYGPSGYGPSGYGPSGYGPSGYGPSGYGSGYGAAAAGKPLAQQAQAQRRRLSLLAVCLCFLGPCVMFAGVCAPMSFSMHTLSPGLTWAIVALGAGIVLACCYLAFTVVQRRFAGDFTREPFWYIFLAVTMALAWAFAVYVGGINWWNNVVPYHELQKLSVHSSVDPATMTGQQLMDVGRVVFVPGTTLDQTKSIGFKNVDQYCVAPITHGNVPPQSYDLWAVGLNCCSGNAADFHCGEFSNPSARAGLRLMREDQKAFYRLAVQQAEAAYNIKADHPLFFYWMQDPVAEMDSFQADAMKYYLLGLTAFCGSQFILLILAVVAHAKL